MQTAEQLRPQISEPELYYPVTLEAIRALQEVNERAEALAQLDRLEEARFESLPPEELGQLRGLTDSVAQSDSLSEGIQAFQNRLITPSQTEIPQIVPLYEARRFSLTTKEGWRELGRLLICSTDEVRQSYAARLSHQKTIRQQLQRGMYPDARLRDIKAVRKQMQAENQAAKPIPEGISTSAKRREVRTRSYAGRYETVGIGVLRAAVAAGILIYGVLPTVAESAKLDGVAISALADDNQNKGSIIEIVRDLTNKQPDPDVPSEPTEPIGFPENSITSTTLVLTAEVPVTPQAEPILSIKPPVEAIKVDSRLAHTLIDAASLRQESNGVTTVEVRGIRIRIEAAMKLAKLLEHAEADGFYLTSSPRGGHRSPEQQAQLRVENGCPDTHLSSSSACRIATARVGESNHESNLEDETSYAVDFGVDGALITSWEHPASKWLVTFGPEYQFYFEVSSEPWHGSGNGK